MAFFWFNRHRSFRPINPNPARGHSLNPRRQGVTFQSSTMLMYRAALAALLVLASTCAVSAVRFSLDTTWEFLAHPAARRLPALARSIVVHHVHRSPPIVLKHPSTLYPRWLTLPRASLRSRSRSRFPRKDELLHGRVGR